MTRRRAAAPEDVVVRMYDVGFGDCVLISVARSTGTWRMLVDCGVHSHGRGPHALSDVIADVIATVTPEDGPPHIDVVVATHRHQDHIAGFDDERWASVEVGEVWLPWTENPADDDARAMRHELDDYARTLAMQLQAVDDQATAMALNSMTNAGAMSTLLDGFAGGPVRSFLRASSEPVVIAGLTDARAHVLGPPADRTTLLRMDPPKDQRWLTGASDDAGTGGPPFDPGLVLDPAAYAERFAELALPESARTKMSAAVAGGADALDAASWLDRCVNNTSVFLALEFGDLVLLLAGDAQWGPWQHALDDDAVVRLVERAALYKVSHHGSHNGTPRRFVEERLRADVVSLISVFPVPAWADIPKTELVDALTTGKRVLGRTDADAQPDRVRRESTGLWIEAGFRRDGT